MITDEKMESEKSSEEHNKSINDFPTKEQIEREQRIVSESKVKEYEPKKFKQCLNLRDRAAQVALNFAGQTIDSFDGTYTLLIDCIYDALREVSEGAFYDEEVFVTALKPIEFKHDDLDSIPVSQTEGQF